MTDRRIEQLFAEATANNWNRREVMKRAAVLGISLPAFVAAMMKAGPAFAQESTPGATPVGSPAATLTFDTSNPLGVKGVGEAGTIASTPAVINAVVDALRPFGVNEIEMPATPERVWRAVHGAQAERAAAGTVS